MIRSRSLDCRARGTWFTVALAVAPLAAVADGVVVDKVYHPYVQPLEREIEARVVRLVDDDDPLSDGQRRYSLAVGRSFSDRWYGELYAIGSDEPGAGIELDAWEVEAKWQLTEQGEFSADWGMLFELERERDDDIWEYSTALLVEKELGRWTGTVNLSAVYEWGSNIRNEWETDLAARLRYRFRPSFEPAVELYSGEDYTGVGPVALGNVHLGGRRNLHWEFGVILGTDSESTDQVWRALVEYEF